jgi:hypothetical protein
MTEKSKKYEAPKAVDLEGQELTEDQLESVAGGAELEGSCTGGGCCSGGRHSTEPEQV